MAAGAADDRVELAEQEAAVAEPVSACSTAPPSAAAVVVEHLPVRLGACVRRRARALARATARAAGRAPTGAGRPRARDSRAVVDLGGHCCGGSRLEQDTAGRACAVPARASRAAAVRAPRRHQCLTGTATAATRPQRTGRWRPQLGGSGGDPARVLDVARHLLDQLLDRVEAQLAAQAREELERAARGRRGRRRSRAGTPRRAGRGPSRTSGARRRSSRRATSAARRPARPPRGRRRRRGRGRTSAGSGTRFAVGKPSVRPRLSPCATGPRSWNGEPRQTLARSISARLDRARMWVEEMISPSTSTSSTTRVANASWCAQQRASPLARWPKRKFSPTLTPLRRGAARPARGR